MSVLESHDSNLNGTKLTKITTSKHKKKSDRSRISCLGRSVTIGLDPRPVCGAKTRTNGTLRLLDPPPEPLSVPGHLFPGTAASCLSGEGPGLHDVHLDDG